MTGEPFVYIALQDDGGQLVIDGPLSLLDRLVTTLTRQPKGRDAVKTELTTDAPTAEPCAEVQP